MKKYRNLLISSIIVGLASLLYIDFYIGNIKFSFAAVVFPLSLYIHDDLNPVLFGFTSGISLFISRLMFYGALQGLLGRQFYYTAPEIIFYIVYGLVFYAVKRRKIAKKYHNIFFICAIGDFTSNMVETYLRIGGIMFLQSSLAMKGFLLVAAIRAAAVVIMVIVYNYYKLFLTKEEHEERYRNLLQIISQLKTEVYWMEKNMDHIERVMANAYELFSEMNEKGGYADWTNKALEIAKDIHEIKKEYKLVVKGIEEVMANRLDNRGMYFKELISILKDTMEVEVRNQNKDIGITYNIHEDFYTEKHYFLMSIFRNLIINAIDSIENRGHIIFSHIKEGSNHKFIVEDNGSGIKEEDLPYIFSPGYSSKINYSTGEINRGLGLPLVENIIRNYLKGSIRVESEYGIGTKFIITIPKDELESEH